MMGMIQTIRQHLSQKKRELSQRGEPSGLLALFRLTLQGGLRMALATWYLRRCTSLGKLVSVNQKPLIINKGVIHLGDEVRIWSNIQKTKIIVDKCGRLTLGRNTRINGVQMMVSKHIENLENVRIEAYCIIIDYEYHMINEHIKHEDNPKPITISDNVWITMNCMFM